MKAACRWQDARAVGRSSKAEAKGVSAQAGRWQIGGVRCFSSRSAGCVISCTLRVGKEGACEAAPYGLLRDRRRMKKAGPALVPRGSRSG